jgi:hypothetical protein
MSVTWCFITFPLVADFVLDRILDDLYERNYVVVTVTENHAYITVKRFKMHPRQSIPIHTRFH